MGGAGGAAMVGLGIGIPLAAAIYGSGTTGFDASEKSSNAITSRLASVHGSELGTALLEAKQAQAKMQQDRGTLGGAVDWMTGGSQAANDKFVADYIAKKEAEYNAYRANPSAAGAAPGGAVVPATATPQQNAQALAGALAARTLRVEVTNMPKEGVDPKGRAPAAGGTAP